MAGNIISLLQPAGYGCNTADEPIACSSDNVGKMVQLTGNMRIHNNRWRTAYRWRELSGFGADLEAWQAGHTQAAIWYNPRSGQGAHYLGVGQPRIIESSAGRMFTLTPKNDSFEVHDVSGGNVARPNLMMAWLCKGENYVIRTDGKSQTQIYDGRNPVQFSPGYSRNNKTASRFPNAASATVYAGGRFWTVLFGRRIYASDALHQTNQENATDLLKFTDQTYDVTNVYFAPPADDDDIVALFPSVDSGYQDSRAQGEVLAACAGPSLWAVQLGIPRDDWPRVDMRRSRSKETSPSGPFAFHVRDGDILMRTAKGIESVNLLARERNTLGNPAVDLGADMRGILTRDDEQLLLFASMVNPPKWSRLICTVTPTVHEARHWHLGYITANFNPLGQRVPQGFAWEGLGTIPRAMGRIVQFIYARVDGRTKVYAILDKEGTSKGLAEMTTEEGHNVLADRSTKPVEWFLQTKKLTIGGQIRESTFGHAWLVLDEMRSDVTVEIYARTSNRLEYQLRRTITVKAKKSPKDVFGCSTKAEKKMSLGKLLEEFKGYTWVQFLIKGKGVCTVDMIIRPSGAGEPDEPADKECLVSESGPPCDFDPYFYALAK